MVKIKDFFNNNKGFLLLLLFLFSFRSSILDWNLVPSGSMIPTIEIGDVVLVNKMKYNLRVPFTKIELFRTNEFERGQIVIFDSKAANTRMIKRLIGVPNDYVLMEHGKLYINGEDVTLSLSEETENYYRFFEQIGNFKFLTNHNKDSESIPYSNFEVNIPENYYLVLGDNRNNSADSRYYGLIHKDEIIGSSHRVLISFNPDNYYLPRLNRFFYKYN